MNFWEGFSFIELVARMVKYCFFSALNVLLLRFTSAHTLALGDTDALGAIILLLSMLVSGALLADAIVKIRKGFFWDYLLYLLFCLFNVGYFFKVYVCCVP